MTQERRFYFRSIARRWQREIAKSNTEVSVFSPYLTSKTADAVVAGVSPERCTIYTRFEGEDFAAGASSLRCLRKLCQLGYPLFEVPGLHAKVVIVPGQFASIGSQNLTAGGTRNREASVAFTDPKEVASVEALAVSLRLGMRKITIERIIDLEAGMGAAKRKFIAARRFARELSRIAERETLSRISERMREFRATAHRLGSGSSDVVARVTRPSQVLVWRGGSPDGYNPPTTLLAQDRDLTRWEVDGQRITLLGAYRYLCLDMQNCRIGWARLFKRRITFVCDGITGLRTSIAGGDYRLDISATRAPEEIGKHNLKARLQAVGRTGELTLRAWVTLGGIALVGKALSENANRALRGLDDWLSTNEEAFAAELLRHVIPPFRYERNRTGDKADEFFGPVGTRRHVRVRCVSGSPVLVVD